jgi:hypothetical protein
MAIRLLFAALLCTAGQVQAGCVERLQQAARHWQLRHAPGVVASLQWAEMVFLFGDALTPDRIVLVGKRKNYTLYQGRILRVPLRAKLRLRDVQEPIFPPTYLLPQAKIPRAVRHRVSGYYTYLFSDDWEPIWFVTTGHGVMVFSKTYQGYVAEELGLLPTEKHKFTYLMLPSALDQVAAGALRGLGPTRPEVKDVLDPSPKYSHSYLMVSLLEGRGIGKPIGGSDLRAILATRTYREPPSEFLDFGEWGKPQWPKPTALAETWVMKGHHSDVNLAERDEDFVLLRYGIDSIRVADESLTDFHTSTISGNKILLTPQQFEEDEIPLGRLGVSEPIELDVTELNN